MLQLFTVSDGIDKKYLEEQLGWYVFGQKAFQLSFNS